MESRTELWREKLEQLLRFAVLTEQMDAALDLDELAGLLRERQRAITIIDRIDAQLTGSEPPADLREAMRQVLTDVASRDAGLRRRLERALQERARRLLAAAIGDQHPYPVPSPHHLDKHA